MLDHLVGLLLRALIAQVTGANPLQVHHEVYADDGMTLEQLMAFSASEDHERQEQVWDLLQSSYNKQPYMIRAKLRIQCARRTSGCAS
jgi:F420-0:gamma-glutamyl ligase-like protein